jgi:hypothetical protein
MRALVLATALIAGPALAQEVTGSVPKSGTLEDFDLGTAARLPPPFPEFSALWSPDRFAAAPLGPFVVVQVRRTEPKAMPAILMSAQSMTDFAPFDRPDGTVAQR